MRTVTSFRLSVFYFIYFLTVGLTLPFLPAYFQARHFSPAEIGVLLSAGPVFAFFALCLGSAAGYALLLGAESFTGSLVALGVYSVFGSSITPVIDAIALGHLAQHPGEYAHLRRWGSLGFVVASLGFGAWVTRIDSRVVVTSILCFAAAAAWAGLTLARAPAAKVVGPRPTVRAAAQLLRQKPLVLLLTATMLHWVANTPYHGSLGTHFTDIGLLPWAIGLTAGVAVCSEVVVMTTWPSWSPRLRPRALLMGTFAVSSARWAGMAATDDVRWLTALAALHGITFGAFYVASVAEVAKLAPESLRATGQALFVASTFGLGGLLGYSGSGVLYGLVGGHRLFALAAVAEWLPLGVIFWLTLESPGPKATAVNGG